jgi:hypothetical protein
MERVRQIIVANSPQEYIVRVKKCNFLKYLAITLYGFIFVSSIARQILVNMVDKKYIDNLIIIIMINIEIVLLISVETSMILIFMRLFNFYFMRVKKQKDTESKFRSLKLWIYTIVSLSFIDLGMRIFMRVISQLGDDVYNSPWATDLYIPFFRFFVPWLYFSKILSMSYLVFVMSRTNQQESLLERSSHNSSASIKTLRE